MIVAGDYSPTDGLDGLAMIAAISRSNSDGIALTRAALDAGEWDRDSISSATVPVVAVDGLTVAEVLSGQQSRSALERARAEGHAEHVARTSHPAPDPDSITDPGGSLEHRPDLDGQGRLWNPDADGITARCAYCSTPLPSDAAANGRRTCGQVCRSRLKRQSDKTANIA